MKPRVEIFPEKGFTGESTFYNEGVHEFHESFTQEELIGRTFYILQSQTMNDKKYAVDCNNGGGNLYHLWEWDKDNLNQIFTMLSNGTIKNVNTSLAMDVVGGNFNNGTLIQNYTPNNTDAQLWTYDSNTHLLKLKNASFVLNLQNDEVKNGGVLNIAEPNGENSQRWDIQLCDIKDTFKARERFAVRFYDPVSALSKEHFSNRFYNPTGDIYLPKSLKEQKETFNTCRAIFSTLFRLHSSIEIEIGDYNEDYFSTLDSNVRGNISTISLLPFTDIILYEKADFSGNVCHIHNGKDSQINVNLLREARKFYKSFSSFKVRAGLMDGKKTIDASDTSGNSVCDIKYRVYVVGEGWTDWVSNGEISGSENGEGKISAIMFHYSGPGQFYGCARFSGNKWSDWLSSGEVCGMIQQKLPLNAVKFKIDGTDNVIFGLETYINGKGWTQKISLNEANEETNSAIGAFKLSVSLKTVSATSSDGKTISIVDFPTDWTITDLSIGKFEKLIGKPFLIKSRKDNSFVITATSDGHLQIKKNTYDIKQIWTVDRDGHICLNAQTDRAIFVPNTKNLTLPDLLDMNESNYAASLLSKWRLNDKNQICSINQPNQILDVKGGSMKEETPIIIYSNNGGNNQIWDVEELQVGDEHDILELKKWVNKTVYISCKACGDNPKYCIDTMNVQAGNGGDIGGNAVGLWNSEQSAQENIKWMVSDKGQILLDADKKWCLYASSTNNGTPITLQKESDLKENSLGQYWIMDENNVIHSALDNNKVLDLSGGKGNCKNGGKLIIYDAHGGANQQWTLTETEGVKEVVDEESESDGDKLVDVGADVNEDKVEQENATSQTIYTSTDSNTSATASSASSASTTTTTDAARTLSSGRHRYWIFGRQKNKDKTKTENEETTNQYQVAQGQVSQPQYQVAEASTTNHDQAAQDQVAQVSTTSNEMTAYANNATISSHSGNWPIGSLRLNPLTDIIIFEEELDKNIGTKRVEIHNGYRNKIYEINDFSKFGLSTIRKIEVKTAKEDSRKSHSITTYEPFKILHKDGKLDYHNFVVIIVLISMCVFCFMMFFHGFHNENTYGRNEYFVRNGWWSLKGF